MKRLKLSVRAIRALQQKHGISNLLNPTPEDAAKLANLDFLVDFYYEGSRNWTLDVAPLPPTRDEIEELDLSDLVAAVKAALSGDAPGNV